MNPMKPPLDFYELQKRQKIRSAGLLVLLFFFYLAAVGLLLLAGLMMIGLLGPGLASIGRGFLLKFAAADVLLAAMIAAFHYLDARKNGAAFLVKRLSAAPPDLSDRYHHMFKDAISAVGLAAGLREVDALVLPTFSLNSLALIQGDGRPAILVTEGLLADCSRDEVEAVIAHEMGHIARGDTTLLTLVCGLASFFERLRDSLEPEETPPEISGKRGYRSAGGWLFPAAALGAVVIRLLAMFVSREREELADACAVEFGRSPEALARVIFKGRARNVFIGDFSASFAPLFLIAPSSVEDAPHTGGRGLRWPGTHPSFEDRVRRLADMAHLTPETVAERVREEHDARMKARMIAVEAASDPAPAPDSSITAEPKDWILVFPGGESSEPMTLAGLIEAEGFKPNSRVKNLHEGLEGRAQDFPQIQDACRRRRQGRPVDAELLGKCPRCGVPLGESFYEGVPARICRRCGGRLVGRDVMNRIIARREIGFSDGLVKKAGDFRERCLLNPAARPKSDDRPEARLTCPGCGGRMRPRPYNYQYFIPVDKCGSCGRIWFDADELEILQILIEGTRPDGK